MITLLTIGQTPREDLMSPFLIEGLKKPLTLKGALDESTEEEIKSFERLYENRPLFVRTRNGTANVGHLIIEEKLQRLITKFESVSEVIIILCTSEFNCKSNESEIVLPVLEMKKRMSNVDKSKRALIFIPITEQYQQALYKWDDIECEKIVKVVEPGTEATLLQMSKVINELKPDYVLLDCYGYAANLPEKIEQNWDCIAYGPQQLVIERLKLIV